MIQRLSQADIERANSVRLSAVIGQYTSLHRKAADLVGLCPFHDERTPSFHVHDDKGFFYCFGCGAKGDAVAFMMRIGGKRFREAVEQLAGADVSQDLPERVSTPAPAKQDLDGLHEASDIWQQAQPIKDTLGERYLRSRGIKGLSRELRFSAELCAVIAAVRTEIRALSAIQRIYLTPAAANIRREGRSLRMTRGKMGDGACRLSEPDRVMGIAESVEKAMAVEQIYALPCWGSLGAHRMSRIALPESVTEIVIFADGDETGIKQAMIAVEAYAKTGRRASLEVPPGVKDWDDLTKGEICQDLSSQSKVGMAD